MGKAMFRHGTWVYNCPGQYSWESKQFFVSEFVVVDYAYGLFEWGDSLHAAIGVIGSK